MLLNVKHNISEIDRICSCVKEFCSSNNISEKKCYDISIIIDELASNVINYAFEDPNEHEFFIKLEKEDDVVHIQILDDGIPFDPLEKSTPDLDLSLDERQIGGLGIFFARQLSKLMTYTRADDKNQLDILVSIEDEE